MQPDQDPIRWNAHVGDYERMFEPLTNAFAAQALAALAPLPGMALLDLAAGSGGAALLAAQAGAVVTAVDGSAGMVARIMSRAAGLPITALQQDGMALDLPDASFDRALSCFGVVLFPEPGRGMDGLYRVLRPGGRAAIVTWTEPQRYELSARLRAATLGIMGAVPQAALPAQLRYIDPDLLSALLTEAGFDDVRIEPLQGRITAHSAEVLTSALGFAPGMAATLDALGAHRAEVLRAFTAGLQQDFGAGPVSLGAVAHMAIGVRP